jgi:hypothetical protein
MSATGAHAQSERTQLYWQSRAWRLIRKTVPLGSSIGSTFYLIPVGLTATWIIAVFFGMSLLFLMPRSAQLASSSSPESTSSGAASAETSRSIQSTSSPEQLSAAPAPRLPLSGSPQQPGDGAAPQLGGPSGQNPALLGLSVMPAEPTAAHASTRVGTRRLRSSQASRLRRSATRRQSPRRSIALTWQQARAVRRNRTRRLGGVPARSPRAV